MLGGKWLFLAIHGRGLRLVRRAVRRSGIFLSGYAGVRLRLRSIHAIGHCELSTSGLEGGRDSRWAGRRAAQERFPLCGQHSELSGAWLAVWIARWNTEQSGGGESRNRFDQRKVPYS